MLYIKMKCGTCGNDYEIYSNEMNHRDRPIRCPHCLRQMDARHWDNLINAFFTAKDWNYQCLKAHNEHGSPLFVAEFITKHVPQELIQTNVWEE